MSNLVVEGHTIALRGDGGLENINDWSPELAEAIAKSEGVQLTDAHWQVINCMRDYYHEYNTSPVLKLLRRELRKKYGPEKGTDEELSRLFPNGVQYQGSRIAGVPVAFLDAELEQTSHVHAVKTNDSKVSAVKSVFEFNGQQIPLYSTGNLQHMADWNEQMADALAHKEGIKLTEEHWTVLNFMRRFYFKYGIAPMVKVLIRHMTEELGPDHANKDHMYELFPGGPARQGSRIAGLPAPQGCIDP